MEKVFFLIMILSFTWSCYVDEELSDNEIEVTDNNPDATDNETEVIDCLTCEKRGKIHEICDNSDGTATITVVDKGTTKLTQILDYKKEKLTLEEIKDQGCEFFRNYLNKKDCLTCEKRDKIHEICDNNDGTATITVKEKGISNLTKIFECDKNEITFEEIKDQGCEFFKKHFHTRDCLTCKDFSICDNGDGKTFTYTNFFEGKVYIDTFEYGNGLDIKVLKSVGCKKEKIFKTAKAAGIDLHEKIPKSS